ncbi:MAG: ABC transporter ATP-binding protein [Lachnospiraceae bacterium]|nr:ABC transporter ATP-binding protein [Lachnospiraceae bacterium]
MDQYILKVNNLCKKYGNTIVLQQVSLSVPTGSIYGLIGENGAGKTTLFRILAGLSRQTSGTIILAGANTEAEIIRQRRNVGFMIESPALYPNLSVLENLYISQMQYCGKKDIVYANQILELVGLCGQKQKKAKHLSLGMKQRLALATALLHDPKILILDEPTNGLDPMGMISFRQLLLKLNADNNISIIISSHILSELEHIATHYGFLHNGKLLKEISSSEISKSADSLEQYYKKIMEGNQ